MYMYIDFKKLGKFTINFVCVELLCKLTKDVLIDHTSSTHVNAIRGGHTHTHCEKSNFKKPVVAFGLYLV